MLIYTKDGLIVQILCSISLQGHKDHLALCILLRHMGVCMYVSRNLKIVMLRIFIFLKLCCFTVYKLFLNHKSLKIYATFHGVILFVELRSVYIIPIHVDM